MNPQLSHFVAQSRQQELIHAAEQARETRHNSGRIRFSRRFRWTLRTPKPTTALSPQVRVA